MIRRPLQLTLAVVLVAGLALLLAIGIGPSTAEPVPDARLPESPVADPAQKSKLARVGATAERVDVDAAAAPGETEVLRATASPKEAQETLLTVKVTDRLGAPVADAIVQSNARGTMVMRGDVRLPHRGALREALATNAEGMCTIEVPPLTPILIQATFPGSNLRSAQGEHPGLRAGSTAELSLVAKAPEGWFFGSVLSAAGGRPIPGASIHVKHWPISPARNPAAPLWQTGAETAVTDGSGCFRIDLAAWEGGLALVSSDGFAPAVFAVDQALGDAANPKVVRLQAAAQLTAQVVGLDPLATDVRVQLTCPLYALGQPVTRAMYRPPHPLWSAKVGRDGRVQLRGLPSGTALEVTVLENRKVLLQPPNPLVLEPGEARSVRWDIGGGATLRIAAVDGHGDPLAGAELALFSGTEVFEDSIQSRFKAVRQSRTDASGALEWRNVPAGSWVIAPPRGPLVAKRFSIAPDPGIVDHVVTIHRDLKIRGRVTTPTGEHPHGVWIRAERIGESLTVRSRGGKGGRFELGPLPSGSYAIRASVVGRPRWGPSITVTADAGSKDVELKLTVGGRLRIRMKDSLTGRSVAGMVRVRQVGGGGFGGRSIERAGEVVLGGLVPGTYDVTGVTRDGAIGILRGVEVSTASEPQTVVITALPAGQVHVTYHGSAVGALISVLQEGAVCESDGLRPGTRASLAAPIGSVEVVLSLPGRTTDAGGKRMRVEHRKTVTIEPGEPAEVVFRIED